MRSPYAPVWFFVIACLVITAAVVWAASRGHFHGDGELCGWNDSKGGRVAVRCDHPVDNDDA